MSLQGIRTDSGVLGSRPYWCPSPFPSPSRLGVFHSLFFICHWISFVFLVYGRRIATHSVDPSLTYFLDEFPGLGLALITDVVIPEAEPGIFSGLSPIARIISQGTTVGSVGQAYWFAACTRQVTSPS